MSTGLEARNLKVVEALFAATRSGNWAAAEELLTEDFFVTEADTLPFAGVYRGRRALHDLFMKVVSEAGVVEMDLQQITAGGDRVVALLDLVLGGPETVRVPLAETFRLRDGRVCEIKPYNSDPRPISAAVEARKSSGAA